MKIVLDTNSLLVSIGRKSKFRPIFDAFLPEKYQILYSNEVLTEYFEILESKTNFIVADNVSKLLLNAPNTLKVNINFKWNLIADDADDNKFVDCALNGQADYLVTDDRHYDKLEKVEFPLENVLKTSSFLEIINNHH